MSIWPGKSRPALPHGIVAPMPDRALPLSQTLDARLVGFTFLLLVLIAQGIAIAHSYLWAAPLICALIVATAIDIPLMPFVGAALLIRVLTDDMASTASRHSGSLNPAALIAGLFILVAIGLLIRRRQSLAPTMVVGIWICIWTAIAVLSQGASTLTIREGMRELSIVSLAVIVFNSRGALNMSVITRLVQVAGLASALLALYQLASHTGADIAGQIRSNATFSHPNDAAVYFGIATMASLWRFTDNGRQRLDLALTVLYSAATLATFSLAGFFSLLVMIATFGVLRSGSRRLKIGACVFVGLLALIFVATPLGAERLANESSTEFKGAHVRHGPSNSLEWRLYRWKTLIPEWEKAPLVGSGLGTTVTAEATSQNTTVGNLPHSEYVRYLVETGALGLGGLLLGLSMLIRGLRRRRRMPRSNNSATFGLALVIGLLVDAAAANTVLYTPGAYAAALTVAAALMPAASRAYRRRPFRRAGLDKRSARTISPTPQLSI